MTDQTSPASGRVGDVATFEDAERHLDPVVDYLSDRFPGVDRDHVQSTVHAVFDELSAAASVPDHLPALTQHHAQERLQAEESGPDQPG